MPLWWWAGLVSLSEQELRAASSNSIFTGPCCFRLSALLAACIRQPTGINMASQIAPRSGDPDEIGWFSESSGPIPYQTQRNALVHVSSALQESTFMRSIGLRRPADPFGADRTGFALNLSVLTCCFRRVGQRSGGTGGTTAIHAGSSVPRVAPHLRMAQSSFRPESPNLNCHRCV